MSDMGIFPLMGKSNFERGPKADFFYVRAQFVAELRRARNVTLVNLWIKCLQWGKNKLKSKSSPTATCNICNMTVSRRVKMSCI